MLLNLNVLNFDLSILQLEIHFLNQNYYGRN